VRELPSNAAELCKQPASALSMSMTASSRVAKGPHSVRRTMASISTNVRRKAVLIARRAVHHCASLHLASFARAQRCHCGRRWCWVWSPACDRSGTLSRVGVVRDAGEAAAQLDGGGQLAVAFEGSTDRGGVVFGD